MTKSGRRLLCAAWAAMALLVLPHGAAAQEPYPGFDAYVVKSMQELKVPGLAIAIVRNDSVIYTKGYGVLAAGSQTPVNENTLFEIGSSTKAFTATLMSMMVSDGKMHYDDLISKYLPDFKLYDPYASAQVTLRDALLHRTGVGRGEWTWIDAGNSREEVLHRVRFLPPESPFRSKWSYQNIMYLAVGQAVGAAAGTSWDDLLQQRIFTPLGMSSSHATYAGVTTTNLAIAHAMDHDTVFRKERFNAQNIAPAGGILTNAVDMGKWLRFQLAGGVFNGKRLVDSAAFMETHSPQILMSSGSPAGGDQPRFSTYGMGWMIQDYRHEVMVQHGGNTPGMTAAVGMLPDKKIAVAVLSNLDHTQLPDMLMHYVFDRHLGEPMHDYVGEALKRAQSRRRPAEPTPPPHVGGPAPLPLSAYVGTYADSMYGKVTVEIRDGNLYLTRGLAHGRLEYWNANNFRWWSNGAISGAMEYIAFDISPDNKVLGVYYGMAPEVELLLRERTAGARAGAGGGAGG